MNSSKSPTQSPHSTRPASLVAGFALLAMAVVAAFANFGAIQPLITAGDAATTAIDISRSEGLFRLGVAGFIVIAVLDIIVAIALLEVFKPVSAALSSTAAWFRVGYTAVLAVAVSHLVAALPTAAYTPNPEQVLAELHLFDSIWQVGLVLFGIHLVLLGYLALKSGFVPRVIGILVVIAGLGYLFDSFALVLFSGFSFKVASFVFVGEVALIFWLLIKGGRFSAAKRTPVSVHA